MSGGGKKRSISSKLSELVDGTQAKKRPKKGEPEVKELSLEQETTLVKARPQNCLKFDFFNTDAVSLCRALLGNVQITHQVFFCFCSYKLYRSLDISGKYLVRCTEDKLSGRRLLAGKIVECEAYPGGDDKASHSYAGKKSERIQAMYMAAGTCYVYNIYGIYCCMNVSSSEAGGAVLIRALEPVSGIEAMRLNRAKESLKELTNGPSKICMALKIGKASFNRVDLCDSELMWIQDGLLDIGERATSEDGSIVAAKRIGINHAGQKAINAPYRLYLRDNRFVSVKAKAE